MQRRHFIKKLGLTLGAGSAVALSGCNQDKSTAQTNENCKPADAIKWKMVTTWPKNFPGLGTGAENLARLINEMSGGRIEVKVYAAGELVPALEVFDAVQRGTAQIGHGGAYYWKGKHEATQFFTSVPFGMTAQEVNAWLFYGDGLKLWQEVYAPFGLTPMPCGNTGVQMAGWFNKEINSVADLKGLKMRIPGLGGEVLRLAGGTPVNLPGGELFTALQSGTIDATEWVGPYNDLAFGLYKAAKYYYAPGWQEPGSVMEAIINSEALNKLPKDLQSIVLNACKVVNADMLAEFTARNNQALETLKREHGVTVRTLPQDVLEELKKLSAQVMADLAKKDALCAKVYASYEGFLKGVKPWTDASELAYLKARG